jgi:hypothetical protein
MNDAPDPRDDTALEILPPDLLPIHQRLEHDGGSWRASLPAPDTLLHRVRERPSRDFRAHEDRATFLSTAFSASLPPRPRALCPRSRRKDIVR